MVPDLAKFIAMVFARRKNHRKKTQLTQVKEKVMIVDFHLSLFWPVTLHVRSNFMLLWKKRIPYSDIIELKKKMP